MSHTPGPWKFYDDSNDGKTNRIEIVAIGKTVARIYHSVPEEDLPNARLIAAAPELLMLVRHVVKYHEPEALNLLFGAGWSEHANKVLANVDGEASLSQTKSPV